MKQKNLKSKLLLVLLVSSFLLGYTSLKSETFHKGIGDNGSSIIVKAQEETVSLGVYSDSDATQQLSSIDWGSLNPGQTTNHTAYLKNTGDTPLYCEMSTANWNITNIHTATFGYIQIGPQSGWWGSATLEGCKFTSPADLGTITKITVYMAAYAGTVNAKAFIYADNGGVLGALLATSSEVTGIDTNFSWIDFTTSYAGSPNTLYWLCVEANANFQINYDNGATNQGAYQHGITYPYSPSPWIPDGYLALEQSIYATYTTSNVALPSSYQQYFRLSWDREDMVINMSYIASATFTLSISSQIQNVTNFSFDIVISIYPTFQGIPNAIVQSISDFIWNAPHNSALIFEDDVNKLLNLTVLNGTFNGNGNLLMYKDNGTLNIDTNMNCVIELSSPNCLIIVNTNSYFADSGPISLNQAFSYQISWQWETPSTFTASISPTSVTMNIGQSQLFTSTVSGGTSPYSYQWYLNSAPVSGATSDTWTFTGVSSGSFTVYLTVTDAVSTAVTSNTVVVTVNKAQSPVSNSTLPSGGPESSNFWGDLNHPLVQSASNILWSIGPHFSVVFQGGMNYMVELTVLQGTFNGTGNLAVYPQMGVLNIDSNTNCTIEVSCSDKSTSIQVDSHSYSVNSGPVAISAGNAHQISWHYAVYIPWEYSWFIIGMIGMFFMVFGPVWGVYKAKHGELMEGLGWALVIFLIGFALVIAWIAVV